MLENIGEDDDKLILGGDLNVIFDPDKDRKGGNFRVTNSYVSVIDVLDDIIENNKLCDIWRTKYPDQRSFTWRQRRP
jgi:exonuclease III